MVPLEAGRNWSACMLGSGAVTEGPRRPPPPASSPENLGQPAGLTLEPSAKSSCCSSVSQSRSDPFLPPTQVPPPPGGGGVPEITLHLPYKGARVGASAWHPGPLTPSSMGGGSCRPQPRLACHKPKCCPQPPHSCSSSQSWGGQLRGPLSGAARDLTYSTLWLIGHRWGPESDGNPAAPRVPCSPPSSPHPRQPGQGKKGLNQGFPFSPQAFHCLTAQWLMTLGTTAHHGLLGLGLWEGWTSQEAAGCHGNIRFGKGSTLCLLGEPRPGDTH